MLKYFLMAGAGGLGALARYSLGGLVHRFVTQSFPWGTFVVNITGCFLFGFVWSWAENRLFFTADHRMVVLTGFMGSFTTFSTFIFESQMLIRDNQWMAALLNLLGQNLLGLVALFAGIALARNL